MVPIILNGYQATRLRLSQPGTGRLALMMQRMPPSCASAAALHFHRSRSPSGVTGHAYIYGDNPGAGKSRLMIDVMRTFMDKRREKYDW